MECDRVDAFSELRQGDIIAAHPGTPNWENRWSRFFIIFSADCDLSQSKTDTGIVVVPIIGLRTYLVDKWISQQAAKVKKGALERIDKVIIKFSGPRLTPDAMLEKSIDEVRERFLKLAGEDAELVSAVDFITKAHGAIRELDDEIKKEHGYEREIISGLLEKVARVRGIAGGNGSFDLKKEIIAGLNALSDSRRLDTWPLVDLIGLDSQMKDDESNGFVACLRNFSSIEPERIFTSKHLWLSDKSGYLRICRLRGKYKSDILQKFANLFVRVGLEDERDSEHKIMFEQAAAKFSGAGSA